MNLDKVARWLEEDGMADLDCPCHVIVSLRVLGELPSARCAAKTSNLNTTSHPYLLPEGGDL